MDEAEIVLKNAKRAAGLAFLCMLVVVLLVVVDGQRNKVLLKQIQEFRALVNGVSVHAGANGAGPVSVAPDLGGPADDGPVPGSDGRDDPAADAPGGTANASDGVPGEAGPGVPWPVRSGSPGGPRGNE